MGFIVCSTPPTPERFLSLILLDAFPHLLRQSCDFYFLHSLMAVFLSALWIYHPTTDMQCFCWEMHLQCYGGCLVCDKVTFLLLLSKLSLLLGCLLLSHVWLFATPWTAALKASSSFTISQSLLKFISIALVMLSNHFILSSSSSFTFIPSTGVFSNELSFPKDRNIGNFLDLNEYIPHFVKILFSSI